MPAAEEGQDEPRLPAGLTGAPDATAAATAVEVANLCTIGRATLVHGKLDAAITCFERALALDPDSPEAVWGLAESLYAKGRKSRALVQFRRFLELRPASAEALHTVAALGGAVAPDRAPDSYLVSLFDRYAEDFDRSLIEDLKYCAPELLRAAVDEVAPAAKRLDIVDLGCGTGLAGAVFHPLARRLAGVDLSPAMLERARTRSIYDALEQAELCAYLSAHPESFDLAVAADAFCYAGELGPAFRAVAAALRAGGWLAFTTERRKGPGWRLTGSGRYAHHPAYLRKAAREAGLEEIVSRNATLRLEYGEPVEGTVSVMRRA
jgi:predicted TPR repeat methyltransferase